MSYYIDSISEEVFRDLIKKAEDLAKTSYPNASVINNFLDMVSLDIQNDMVEKMQWSADLNISHKRLNTLKDAFWQTYKMMENPKGPDYRGEFVMRFRNPLEDGIKLTNQQHTAIAISYTFMEYDGYLKQKKKPMDRDTLGQALGYEDTGNDSSFRKNVLSPLVKAGVFETYRIEGNGQKTYYKFTEKYAFKGRNENEDKFLKIFQHVWGRAIEMIKKEEAKGANLKKTKSQNSAIGTLNAIISSVNYISFHFTKDPADDFRKPGETVQQAIDREAMKKSRKKHVLLTDKDLRKLAVKGNKHGMAKATFDKHMTLLRKIGILYLEDSGGNNNYLIFPLLVSAHVGDGKDDYTKSVIAKFFKTWGSNGEKILKDLGIDYAKKEFPELFHEEEE